jgi:hypothetical protein
MTKKKGWISKVTASKSFKEGSLHDMLKIPRDQTIPLAKLRWAAKQPGLLGVRARSALNMMGKSQS